MSDPTPADIRTMKAGPELDALVDRSVFGRPYAWHHHYSGDWSDAVLVLEKMRPYEPVLSWSDERREWQVSFDKLRSIVHEAPAGPLAISRAAIIARMERG